MWTAQVSVNSTLRELNYVKKRKHNMSATDKYTIVVISTTLAYFFTDTRRTTVILF